MYPTAGVELISFLTKSSRIKSITEPLNTGAIRYYSVMNDGSSSAKTMDEKELFLMKSAQSGKKNYYCFVHCSYTFVLIETNIISSINSIILN